MTYDEAIERASQLDRLAEKREKRLRAHQRDCLGCYTACDPWWRDYVVIEKRRFFESVSRKNA